MFGNVSITMRAERYHDPAFGIARTCVSRFGADRAGFERQLAAFAEGVARDAASRRVIDQLRHGGELRLIGNRVRQEPDGSGNDREHVVEVMKNAADELAHDRGALNAILPRLDRRR